jgi:hypothetical protein
VKRLLIPAIIGVLGQYVIGCGDITAVREGSVKSSAREGDAATMEMRPLPVGHYIRGDYDDDDNGGEDPDDVKTRTFGHRANGLEAHAAEEIVTRYYAAAATEDGATACRLMDSRLAKSRDYAKVVPPEYAPSPGSSIFRGKACKEIASLVFEPAHQQLVADAETVKLAELRVAKANALAILLYTTDPESEIPLKFEHGKWKVDAFLPAPLV